MASSDDYDIEEVTKKLKEFSATQSKSTKMNSKTAGKMAKQCFPKDLQTRVDSSVFPKCADKKTREIDLEKKECVKQFMCECAVQYSDVKKDKNKDPETLKKREKEVADKILAGDIGIKETKISKTGGVDKMTDTSKYTGAHKERFDAEGKGKGAAGRTDKAENTGYVGNYKGAGTYDKK